MTIQHNILIDCGRELKNIPTMLVQEGDVKECLFWSGGEWKNTLLGYNSQMMVCSVYIHTYMHIFCGGARGVCGGARGVIVIVVGNEHGDMSSNPGRDWLHFT